jgi:hypothetical protein
MGRGARHGIVLSLAPSTGAIVLLLVGAFLSYKAYSRD